MRSAALDAVASVAGLGGALGTARQQHLPRPIVPTGSTQAFSRKSLEVGIDATPASTRLPDGRRVEDADEGVTVWWSLERLQAYLAHIKTFRPMLNVAAQTVLKKYYALQRRADTRSAARTTVRLLDSLVRITQAHARLLRRNAAVLQDAIIAVTLMETSTHAAAVIGVQSPLHATFSLDPDGDFAAQKSLVLHRLGLAGLTDDNSGESPANGDLSQRGGLAAFEEEAAIGLAIAMAPKAFVGVTKEAQRHGDSVVGQGQRMTRSGDSPPRVACTGQSESQQASAADAYIFDFDAARVQLAGSFPDTPHSAEHGDSLLPVRKGNSVCAVANPPAAPAPPEVAQLPKKQIRGTDWFNNPGHLAPPRPAFNVTSIPIPKQRGLIHEPSASLADRSSPLVQFHHKAMHESQASFLGRPRPESLASVSRPIPPSSTPLHEVPALRSVEPVVREPTVPSRPAVKPNGISAATVHGHDLLELSQDSSSVSCVVPPQNNLSLQSSVLHRMSDSNVNAKSVLPDDRVSGRKRAAGPVVSENVPLTGFTQRHSTSSGARFTSNPFVTSSVRGRVADPAVDVPPASSPQALAVVPLRSESCVARAAVSSSSLHLPIAALPAASRVVAFPVNAAAGLGNDPTELELDLD